MKSTSRRFLIKKHTWNVLYWLPQKRSRQLSKQCLQCNPPERAPVNPLRRYVTCLAHNKSLKRKTSFVWWATPPWCQLGSADFHCLDWPPKESPKASTPLGFKTRAKIREQKSREPVGPLAPLAWPGLSVLWYFLVMLSYNSYNWSYKLLFFLNKELAFDFGPIPRSHDNFAGRVQPARHPLWKSWTSSLRSFRLRRSWIPGRPNGTADCPNSANWWHIWAFLLAKVVLEEFSFMLCWFWCDLMVGTVTFLL